jgi:hypothetical protein
LAAALSCVTTKFDHASVMVDVAVTSGGFLALARQRCFTGASAGSWEQNSGPPAADCSAHRNTVVIVPAQIAASAAIIQRPMNC